MSVYSKHARRVFHHYMPALIKAEHARHVAILLGAIPYFRLVNFFRKILPKNTGKLYAHADINLVILQGNAVLRAPLGKITAAASAHSPYDMRGAELPVSGGVCIMHGVGCFFHIRYVRIGENGDMPFQKLRHFSHGVKVGVCAQMLQLGLRHVKVEGEAFFLQLVRRHKALGRRPEMLQNVIRLFDIIQHSLRLQKLRQPAAVFCGDNIFPVGKSPRPSQTLHN